MDAATLYDGLLTDDGLPIIIILIGLPILFVFFVPVICLIFGAIGAIAPFVVAVFTLIIQAIYSLLAAFFKPRQQIACAEIVLERPVKAAKPVRPAKPARANKAPIKKKEKVTYSQTEMDVVYGLKGLGMTIKDGKTLVKKVAPDGENLDTVSLMNKCLEYIKSR